VKHCGVYCAILYLKLWGWNLSLWRR